MNHAIGGTMLAAILFGSMEAASADSIPGMRGHDHTGVTVPDMKQAVDFFTNVVGCKKAMSFGPFTDDKGTFMQDLLGVDPKAVIEEITMVRCGTGSNIELFKYTRICSRKTAISAASTSPSMSTMLRPPRPISMPRA